MEYQKPDPRAVKGWRISQGIAFAVLALTAAAVIVIICLTRWEAWQRWLVIGGAVIAAAAQGVPRASCPRSSIVSGAISLKRTKWSSATGSSL